MYKIEVACTKHDYPGRGVFLLPNKDGVVVGVQEHYDFAEMQLSIDQAEELLQHLKTILNHK